VAGADVGATVGLPALLAAKYYGVFGVRVIETQLLANCADECFRLGYCELLSFGNTTDIPIGKQGLNCRPIRLVSMPYHS
jgi:hypothetical protein